MKPPDCGDNSCRYMGNGKVGMRTNGGCRCDACPSCGAHVRPRSPGKHYNWCPTPDWMHPFHRAAQPETGK